MPRISRLSILFLAALTVACQQSAPPPAEPEPEPVAVLETDAQRNSYAMGADLAQQVVNQGMHLETESFIAGLRDVLSGAGSQLGDEEVQTRVAGVRAQEAARLREERAKPNRDAAKTFFAENGQREGVITTDSGLQYEVLQAGDGPKPGAADMVTVHYRGTLLDGTEFDSSYARGEPATFPLNRVIAGWTEALQLMPIGSKYKLYIPAQLAYGDRGAGDLIGPGAALVFEVELISIDEAAAAEG